MQFPDVVEFCEEMANMGKTVIVAALDGTFQRQVRVQYVQTASLLPRLNDQKLSSMGKPGRWNKG